MFARRLMLVLIFAPLCEAPGLEAKTRSLEKCPRHHHINHAIYHGPSVHMRQLPRELRPLYNPPRHSDDDLPRKFVCRDGMIPSRKCGRNQGSNNVYDANQLVDALLSPPSRETRGAITYFGLPNVDGVPPAAILSHPGQTLHVPYPFQERWLRQRIDHGLR